MWPLEANGAWISLRGKKTGWIMAPHVIERARARGSRIWWHAANWHLIGAKMSCSDASWLRLQPVPSSSCFQRDPVAQVVFSAGDRAGRLLPRRNQATTPSMRGPIPFPARNGTSSGRARQKLASSRSTERPSLRADSCSAAP
jgi:hypothetical protein